MEVLILLTLLIALDLAAASGVGRVRTAANTRITFAYAH